MKRGNNNVSPKISDEESSICDTHSADEDVMVRDRDVDSDEISNNTSAGSDENTSDNETGYEYSSGIIKSKSEKLKEEILDRYEERQGKQLYIRFPCKIPETQESLEEKVKELSPMVIKVHKPRQRHVRFCLVDFATKEDRNKAFNKLKKSIKKGELTKYVVSIPRTESSDFIEKLVERKIQSVEKKKAKRCLKKASKKALKENNFTSTVIVFNLPKSTSVCQIRELFKDSVDINVKPGKGHLNKDKCIAAITFPTTMDATNVVKRKLSLEGNELIIKFDNKTLVKQKKIFKDNIDSKNNNPAHIPENLKKSESPLHIQKGRVSKIVSFQKSNKSRKTKKSAVNKTKVSTE